MEKINHSLPWHRFQWESIFKRKAEEKLPHALLLSGAAFSGKEIFARQFAKSLLCSNSKENKQACNNCKHCELFESETHPDFLYLSFEDDSKVIKIDQIRHAISFAEKTSLLGRYKVIIINPADALNINAANALLKTLEEPSDKTIIILITGRKMALPATIRSRCQMINFSNPSRDMAIDYLTSVMNFPKEEATLLLSLAKGSPLKAIYFKEQNEIEFRKNVFRKLYEFLQGKIDLVTASTQLSKLDLHHLFSHLANWATDLIIIKKTGDKKYIVNQDVFDYLQKSSINYDEKKLHDFLGEINKAQSYLNSLINLNPQLLVEGVLLKLVSED